MLPLGLVIQNGDCSKKKIVSHCLRLSNRRSHQKFYQQKLEKFFQELDTPSFKKISRYSYANTYDGCCGTDGCYFCVVIDYTHEEFCRRRETNNICSILNRGKNCLPLLRLSEQ